MALQLNFNQMYFFYMVAKHQGVRNAAKALHVSPPAVSAQVKRLEENLGIALITREAGKLHLTDYGKRIFPEVERLFEQAEYLERFMAKVQQEKEEEILVGAHYVHLQSLTPRLMPYYELVQQGCPVQFVAAAQDVLEEKLLNNEVSVAFLEHEVQEEGLHCHEFYCTKAVFVVCAQNPLVGQGAISLQDLVDMHIYLPKRDSGFVQCLDAYFERMQFAPVRTETFTIPIILRLLRNSPYGAFLPAYMLEDDLHAKHVTCIPVIEDLPEMKMYIAHAKKYANDAKVQKILQFLQERPAL